MSSWVTKLDRMLYPTFTSNWDDELFRQRILARLSSDSIVLDLGAGAGIVPQMNFRGRAARVCGVDLDPRVASNPMLDEGKLADAERIPYGNDEFDVVFADNVLEHLAEPIVVFKEVRRVLRPGGVFLFKTPNRFHYMPMIARYTPHGFHRFYNRRRGRNEEDTFPTHYRANTRAAIGRIANAAGLEIEQVELVEGRPEYLRLTALTYIAGAAYERLVNSASAFEGARILLLGAVRKPVA